MKCLFLSGRYQWCSPNNTPKTRQHPLQKFENMHNNWPKTSKKKIPSFLSGDEEPKAQNKNSVCGLSLRAFVLSLPLGNLLRVACEGHAYPAAGAREDGGRYDTYAVTETPALSGFSPGNRPWRCPRWRAALKASLSPGLKKKTVYMTTDVFL